MNNNSTDPNGDLGGDDTALTASLAADEAGTLVEYKPLRVWPAILLIVGMFIARAVPSLWTSGPSTLWMLSAFGPLLCSLGIVVWWTLLSRARWQERLVGFLGLIALMVATYFVVHPSMRGPALFILSIPLGIGLFGLMAVLCGSMLSFRRTRIALMVACIAFGFSATAGVAPSKSDLNCVPLALPVHFRTPLVCSGFARNQTPYIFVERNQDTF